MSKEINRKTTPVVIDQAAPTTSYFYGSAAADQYLFHCRESFLLYGHLARKVMMHYLGDRYNPHEHGMMHEPFIREKIKEAVAYKVLYRQNGYDWCWIDHAFRKYFSTAFGLNLPWDQAVLDNGFRKEWKAETLVNMQQAH